MPHGSVTLVLFLYNRDLHCFLFGPSTKPQKVGDLANKCDVIFIIEFQPAGFYPFTNINQKELVDKIMPFSWIDATFDTSIKRAFLTSSAVDEILQAVEEILLLHIRSKYPKELSLAMKAIIQAEGVINSEEISDHASYCSRHLNRLFNQYLGLSMKSFSRLVRINKAIRLMNDKRTTLADVGNTLGYYDESHFVKDFKLVCAITPQAYKSRMSDFYNEIAKY